MVTLVDGKIPANTECPFEQRCEIKAEGACSHTGVLHSVAFSCAAARSFELLEELANHSGKELNGQERRM